MAVRIFSAAYSTSKGAMNTLTRNVAMAYRKRHIRCNAILPGWMDTPGEDAVQKKWHGAGDDWLQKAEASSPSGSWSSRRNWRCSPPICSARNPV